MKLKLNIQRQVQLQPDILEEKINKYLVKNSYKIIERGPGFIDFIDDEFSERKRARSDFHTRIGEGRFEFHSSNQEINVKLIYFTPILFPVFVMVLFIAVGIYAHSFNALIGIGIGIPIAYKVYYLNEHVFNEILGS